MLVVVIAIIVIILDLIYLWHLGDGGCDIRSTGEMVVMLAS